MSSNFLLEFPRISPGHTETFRFSGSPSTATLTQWGYQLWCNRAWANATLELHENFDEQLEREPGYEQVSCECLAANMSDAMEISGDTCGKYCEDPPPWAWAIMPAVYTCPSGLRVGIKWYGLCELAKISLAISPECNPAGIFPLPGDCQLLGCEAFCAANPDGEACHPSPP